MEGGGKESRGISNLVSYSELIYCYYHRLDRILLFIPLFPIIIPIFLLSCFKYLQFTTLQAAFLWRGKEHALKRMLIVNTLTLLAVLDAFKTFTWNNLKEPFTALPRADEPQPACSKSDILHIGDSTATKRRPSSEHQSSCTVLKGTTQPHRLFCLTACTHANPPKSLAEGTVRSPPYPLPLLSLLAIIKSYT